MSLTPLPLLRHLAPNVLVARCPACGTYRLAEEVCQNEGQVALCNVERAEGPASSRTSYTFSFGEIAAVIMEERGR